MTRYAYDQNGNLVSQTGALGQKTTYTYDALNRMTWSASSAASRELCVTALAEARTPAAEARYHRQRPSLQVRAFGAKAMDR